MNVSKRKVTQPTSFAFNEANEAAFKQLLPRYPTREAAMIPALWLVQDQEGWLPQVALQHVADRLELPISKVLGVVTFYTMFKLEPTATYDINICQTIGCWLKGAEDLVGYAEGKLGIKAGETTPDGLFCLQRVECLASCHTAPVVQVNIRDFDDDVTPEKFDAIIERLRNEAR